MRIRLEHLEEQMTQAILHAPHGFMQVVREHGFDDEAVGVWCGTLAVAAVESLGIDRHSKEGQRLGPVITTTALAAFEVALRAKEAYKG